MLKVGVIGVTGFAGELLLDILLKHPKVKITYLAAKIDRKQNIAEIFPKFKGKIDLECDEFIDKENATQLCELIFLALPHTVSLEFAPFFLKAGKKVIDLSADYRLKSKATYEQFYHVKHSDAEGLRKSVYGLPEIYREKIKNAVLVANPGCYPTAAILALMPLVKYKLINPDTIIIDAKSGFSGAGREMVAKQQKEILNNFKAYKVGLHQHTPEMEQEFSYIYGKKIKVVFVPHLLPIERGILATIYVRRAQGIGHRLQGLISLYKEFYKKEPFIRIRDEGDFPSLKDVVGTNFCDIAIKDQRDKIIIVAVIDNLLKGASGQAVQNMNIMYGFPETTALSNLTS